MVPMALPTVGGMTVAILTMLTTPTIFFLVEEFPPKPTQKPENAPQKESKS
jgi:hypothetical protein